MRKPRLLVISHVYPFPGSAGQQQRVRYKLEAFREHFHLTFLTYASIGTETKVQQQLLEYCDEAIVLTSRVSKSRLHRLIFRLISFLYTAYTGLKRSNFLIGRVELTPKRVASIPKVQSFDCVVFEYWHAVNSARVFQNFNIPCVLDMHDILWKSYEHQLEHKHWLPQWWKRRALMRYQEYEHKAWENFDALIAINAGEHKHIQSILPDKPTFLAPMGIDTTRWPYSWETSSPQRIAYYGGLGNPYNQREAMRCYHRIMPHVWQKYPDTEYWILGSNPPEFIQALSANDMRVHVPGFVQDIQRFLKTMTVVLCPFEGQFGFRSRLIEAMSLGVPVAATPDAVFGMDMDVGQGLYLNDDDQELARYVIELIAEPEKAQDQSQLARQQIERKYSFDATYENLAKDLIAYTNQTTKTN